MKSSTSSLICLLFLCLSFEGFSQDLGSNIAFDKTTEQSSTSREGYSWKAVDGNTSGAFDNDNYAANSVTHTGEYVTGTTEWWRVDLGAVYELSLIRIYNRTDEEGRLDGAELFVGNIDSNEVDDYRSVGSLTGALMQVHGNNLGMARYVMVRQQGILSLAEVEVYAFPENCPPVDSPCDDDNPNTINDVEDGDCNCVGTPVVCDDLSLEYQINSGIRSSNASEITVVEGDEVGLFLNLDGIDYVVEDPTNTILSSGIINNITSSQAGLYTLIPVMNPVIFSADSEERFMEDGHASNALDDDEDTIWHTEWSVIDEPYPHEIVIDLRTVSNVTGLDYLPRQDDILHGMIAEYEIYVSNSTTDWGDPVAFAYFEAPSTDLPWAYTEDLKTVNFGAAQGRYVRLVALSEGGNNHWASAAEIRVTHEAITPCIKTIQINVGTAYTYDGTTWTPSDPNTSAIGPNDSIRIDSGNAEISSDITCYSVTVAPGAGLTIDSGFSLSATVTTLQSRSDSYSSLILNGEINGTVNYERYVNVIGTSAGGGNDLVSAPLADQTFGTFAAANPDDLAASGNLRAFAPYNTAVGAYQNYNVLTNATTPIELGKGFRAASNLGSTLTFTGIPSNTAIAVPVSDAAAGNAWNLIGNPYPSYLDFTTFFTTNFPQLESGEAYQAIYGYNGKATSDKWEIWNLANTTPDSLIAPGQGFFVKVKSGAGDIQFTPEMRRIGSSNDFIVGRSANLARALSKIKVTRGSNHASTSIYFIEGTTKGLDPGYDAGAYSATPLNFSLFTNLVEDNIGVDIAIQALPYSDFNDVVVPLGIKANAGSELSITIDELSTLPSHIKVYLEDSQNKTLTLLNDDYFTFTPTVDLIGTGRFNIHYSSRALSIDDLDVNDNLRIYATVSPKTLFVMGQLTGATTAHLYDLQGRLVLSQKLNPSTTENTMDISTITTGVYVVKLNNDHQIKTQKVIIK